MNRVQINDYQRYIAMSRYARYLPEKKRRETWEETVQRYVDYFYEKFPDTFPRERVYDAIVNMRVMPSMRALMTAGKALDRDNIAGYNCSYICVDDIRAFDEAMYILMCFAPETLVKTKFGEKKISELTYDDEVLTRKENGEYEFRKPSNIVETPSEGKEKIELEFEDGHKVQCTKDHKFLTKNRGWVEAQDLTEEDDIENYHEI